MLKKLFKKSKISITMLIKLMTESVMKAHRMQTEYYVDEVIRQFKKNSDGNYDPKSIVIDRGDVKKKFALMPLTASPAPLLSTIKMSTRVGIKELLNDSNERHSNISSSIDVKRTKTDNYIDIELTYKPSDSEYMYQIADFLSNHDTKQT